VRGLLRPAFAADASDTALLDRLQSALSPYEDLDPGRRMLLADFHTYLPDNMLLRTDKVLMAASIEGRVPLLDRTLVERASATSVGSRFTWRRGKTLLRSAVEDLVPRAILEAPKRGFPVPTTRLLLEGRGPDLVRMLLSERALSRGILEPDAVKAIVCPDGATVTQRDLKLFTLISLELWLRTNVDSVRLRPPESLDELLVDS
jgi:asparagine synthase (glutamine-hydrolysing)